MTLRMEGHTVHDDAFYVPKLLIEEWAKRDPMSGSATGSQNAELTEDEEEEILSASRNPERRAETGRRIAAAFP